MKSTTSATIKQNATVALRSTFISLVKTILFASCASTSPTVLHERVGPTVSAQRYDQIGFLQVFDATAWSSKDDDGPRQFNYTEYQISGKGDSLFQRVPNNDEEPTRVNLPKGNYTVIAQSETAGEVKVPVAIEPGRLTEVHLGREKDWKIASSVGSNAVVRLPNGQPIGFRALRTRQVKAALVAAQENRAVVASQ